MGFYVYILALRYICLYVYTHIHKYIYIIDIYAYAHTHKYIYYILTHTHTSICESGMLEFLRKVKPINTLYRLL